MSASVDVVVLNWNGRRHLETCLAALAEQRDGDRDWQVVVVDNGSTDDSLGWLERHFPDSARLGSRGRGRVRVLALPENVGFCRGNNAAVDGSSADSVVFLNNDTAPHPDWLRSLCDALDGSPPDVAAVSGKLVDWDEERVDFVEGVVTFDGHAFQRGYRKPLESWRGPASGAELPFACGGSVALRRESFEAAGRFDPSYFAYLEDVDLGWRLWSGGERILYCDEAVARHRSMATSDQLGRDRRGFLFERNAFLTAFKNLDDQHFRLLMPAILWTLLGRTRTLVADNNQGGDLIRRDPYGHGLREDGSPPFQPTLWQKWRGWGTAELARRGVRKLRRRLAAWIDPEQTSLEGLLLDDPRALAQLQAVNHLLDHLDDAAHSRRSVQARRRRSDREILERFPLHLVPTYPGDEALFADEGFRSLLPLEVPLVETTLDALMEMG